MFLGAAAAGAHLRAVGGSLVDLLARSEGVVLVEVTAATEDAPASRTQMRRIRSLGGVVPPEEFALGNALSPMRYAGGQKAIVVLTRENDRWQAIQLAGEGLVLAPSEPDAATLAYVSALWKATHEAEPDGDLGLQLRGGLRLPHRKLRLLAALDLAELAHHKPGLSPAARAALRKDLEDPELDPAARLALSRALGDS